MFRAAFLSVLLLGLAACGDAPEQLTPLERAQAALAAGDGFGAEVELRALLDAGTPREELAAYLGEAELLQGELAEARRWLADGEFSEDAAGHGFLVLGRLEMRQGNLPAAGQAFDRAYAYIPEDADLWVDVARLRFRGGEQTLAVEASKRAVELGPENPRALRLHAQLVRDAEGLRAALPWFEAALEHNPDDVDALADYAATLGDLGQARAMLAVVRRMAEIDDRNPQVFRLQAVLAARGGQFALARSLLQRAGPAEAPADMLLAGIVDLENGNFESAAQKFDRLAAMQPDNRRVRQLLARAIALGLNDRELVYRFDGIARLPSASPYLRLLVGRAYESLDERDRAAHFLDLAALGRDGNLIAVQGGTPLAVAELRGDESGRTVQAIVRGRIVVRQTRRAVTEAEAFRERFPGSGDALALAADARLANREVESALELYDAAAAVRRTWPLVRRMVAAHRITGRDDAAAALVADYLAGDPNNAEAAAELGRIAIARQDWARAALLLDHAIDHGGAGDPALWSLRSLVARQMGEDELAYDAAVYAYSLQPMARETNALLAGLLNEQGEGDTATALAAKLAKLSR